MLGEFCFAAEQDFFYSCVWEAVVCSPAVRQAAIDYVLRQFNKKQIMEDQLHFIGTNIDLLVRYTYIQNSICFINWSKCTSVW